MFPCDRVFLTFISDKTFTVQIIKQVTNNFMYSNRSSIASVACQVLTFLSRIRVEITHLELLKRARLLKSFELHT